MHTVSPVPDFDDSEKVDQYIQDKRVLGVCLIPSLLMLMLNLLIV
jgi:hypothetical protein